MRPSPAIILSQRKLLHPGLWTLPGGGIHPMTSHCREIKPGPLAEFRTSLKRHPSFHIPPLGQPKLQLYHSSDSGSTQCCFPHSLTTPQKTCSKLSISESASQENWPTPSSLEFHLLYSVSLYQLPIFYCSHKCSRSLHILRINSPLVLDVTDIYFFNQSINFVHGMLCWLESFNFDVIKFMKFCLMVYAFEISF